jgi:DNA topoisomerase-2
MKKYKTIKPGDVKNKLSIVVFFKNFPSMQFDSQTKETLTNSVSDIKKFLNLSNDDFLDMTKKIMKNEAILEPIVEMFKLKEEFKKRQALKNLSSGKKRITSESYFPPIGDKKYLMLTEGFSATSSMWNILGRRDIAYYSLRGKPLNTFNVPTSKMIANKEFKDIIDVLNLNLLDKDTDMDYEKIIFLSDQDSDGVHIRSLLLTFFYKFTPKMIEDGRIFFMNTPLLIQFDKRDKPINWFFTIEEYNDFVEKNPNSSSLRTKYYKGLGSFNPLELSEIIKKVGSMENFFTQFTKTTNSEKSIKEWMSSGESNARKEFLTGRSFNLSSI